MKPMEMANEITDITDMFLELDGREAAMRVSDALLPHVRSWIAKAVVADRMQQFERMVNAVAHRQPEWRLGQTYCNVLWDFDSAAADLVRGTLNDPFNQDARINEFRKWLRKFWLSEWETTR